MRGILLALPLFFWLPFSGAAPRPLPPPPSSFVYDEARVLKPQTVDALQTLFKTQERSTGEQIIFVIFKSLEEEDPVVWTNRIFHSWKMGQKGKDNGVLLAVYWAEHKARIEVGYGLESKLTDAKAKRILAETLAPSLKKNLPDQAFTQSALEILKIIESPLIQNGQAAAILNGAHLSLVASPAPRSANFIWVILCFFLVLIFGRAFLYRGDRNFERNRWRPSDPLGFRRRRESVLPVESDLGHWGSGSGGSFGGGGSSSSDNNDFSGGGGNSGGGGASQDW